MKSLFNLNTDSESSGVANMAVASFFFFFMSLMVKLLEGIPISQIVFFRALVAILICLGQLKYLKVSPWGEHKVLLLQRGFFGTCAMILFFSTLQVMPLASAVTIQYMAPIFTTVLTCFFLKERFFRGQVFFFILAFCGVVTIKGFSATGLGAVTLGVLGALCAACAYATIRRIQAKGGEHPLVIIFYFPLVTIPLILPKLLLDWVTPTPIQWLYLVGVGFFVQIAQYFMTRAYQLGEASVVSIAGYLGVIWASLGGYFLFSESVSTPAMIGMLMVLGGVVGNTIYRMKRNRSVHR